MESTTAFQTAEFTVRADRDVPVEVDGEWVGRYTEVRFKEAATLLRVLAPDVPPAGRFADTLKSFFHWPKREPELQTSRSR